LNRHVRELTSDNWEGEVLGVEGPVLVDFWAEWCAPCRMIGPAIDQVAMELAGRVTVGKLDVDRHPAVAVRYEIRSIPTLLVFRGGRIVARRLGALAKSELLQLLDTQLAGSGAAATP
jgi:thioredoxin 1